MKSSKRLSLSPANGRTKSRCIIAIVAAITGWSVSPVSAEDPYELKWWQQLGSPADDFCKDVAVDAAGNAYITGDTTGDLFGPTAGARDAFIAKFDDSGAMLWSLQFGTPSADRAAGVAVDAAGNVYVSGSTSGDLGGPAAGSSDAYLAKFDASGAPLWSLQFGTSLEDAALGIAIDSLGDIYISGYSYGDLAGPSAGNGDAILAKVDPRGAVIWIRQIGSPEFDSGTCIAIDGDDNSYLVTVTPGKAFRLVRYDSTGNELWIRQFTVPTGTGLDINAITADGTGNAYLTGHIGLYDVFLAKYDSSGDQIWTREFGTPDPRFDVGEGIALDSAGDLLICGSTDGSLGGPGLGFTDLFLAKYDPAGRLLWLHQFGTPTSEYATGLAIDGQDNACISVEWREDPFSTIADVALARLGPVNEPCYADCDRSGALDFGDLLCFQNSFALGATYADCDGTGALDFFDFLCFQNSFAAGCPG